MAVQPPSDGVVSFSARRAERLRTADAQTRKGVVYYVSYGAAGPIKIGYVDRISGLFERLRGLQTACPYDLMILAAKSGTMRDERALHERFGGKRLRGEWFARHTELTRHISGVARTPESEKFLSGLEAFTPPPVGAKKLRVGKRVWLLTA